MAKAAFHKNQRVYVRPVGTWATIEQVKPQWVKGVEEPVRIYYCTGLGRDFVADELAADAAETGVESAGPEHWRLMRVKNKWQDPAECANHPVPGTFPIIVTDTQDWGGWRVPGAEYDRDPVRIERQARLIATAPQLLRLAESLCAYAGEETANLPDQLGDMARAAGVMVRAVESRPEELITADDPDLSHVA